MTKPFVLSVVIPVYQAAAVLHRLAEELHRHVPVAPGKWEAICVDDGSTDGSWEVLYALSENYPAIVPIRHPANLGQHKAIATGLARAQGEWVVVMDCDLGDNPAALPALYQKAREGHLVVRAVHPPAGKWHHQLTSRIFHRVFTLFTGIAYPAHIGNFGIYHHSAIRQMMQQPDPLGIFTIQVARANLPLTDLPVVQGKPSHPSSYSLKRRCQLAFRMVKAYRKPFIRSKTPS
jgi:dolichol-phosphate mannosyltransferase